MKEKLRIIGRVRIELRWLGEPIRVVHARNLIVDSGDILAAKLLIGQGTPVDHIALGDDATAVAETQAKLVNEINRKKVDGTTRAGATVTHSVVFKGGWAGTIREAGLFNASGLNNGEMFSRVVLDEPLEKTSALEVAVDWAVEVP